MPNMRRIRLHVSQKRLQIGKQRRTRKKRATKRIEKKTEMTMKRLRRRELRKDKLH